MKYKIIYRICWTLKVIESKTEHPIHEGERERFRLNTLKNKAKHLHSNVIISEICVREIERVREKFVKYKIVRHTRDTFITQYVERSDKYCHTPHRASGVQERDESLISWAALGLSITFHCKPFIKWRDAFDIDTNYNFEHAPLRYSLCKQSFYSYNIPTNMIVMRTIIIGPSNVCPYAGSNIGHVPNEAARRRQTQSLRFMHESCRHVIRELLHFKLHRLC